MSAPCPAATDLRPPPALAGMRIGLLGGSFNPPHAAHRLISLTALKRLGAGPGLVDGDARKSAQGAWRAAAARPSHRGVPAGFSHPRIKITAFEARIGTAYTERSLSFLRRRFPGVHFVWLMGADNLASFHRWKEWETDFPPDAHRGRGPPGMALQSDSLPRRWQVHPLPHPGDTSRRTREPRSAGVVLSFRAAVETVLNSASCSAS